MAGSEGVQGAMVQAGTGRALGLEQRPEAGFLLAHENMGGI